MMPILTIDDGDHLDDINNSASDRLYQEPLDANNYKVGA